MNIFRYPIYRGSNNGLNFIYVLYLYLFKNTICPFCIINKHSNNTYITWKFICVKTQVTFTGRVLTVEGKNFFTEIPGPSL